MKRVETPEGEKNAQFSLRGPIVRGKTSLRFNGQANSSFQSQMINSDPPDHGRMRGVYEPAFRPKRMPSP